jgi:LacI family transcriptional regulator
MSPKNGQNRYLIQKSFSVMLVFVDNDFYGPDPPFPRNRMDITMQDVAREAGLSLPTVSRVLSGSDYPIQAETRRRVLDAATRLGYRPNLAARGLRTRRTNSIGIVVDDIMSAFVPPIVRGIQDRLDEADFSGLLVNVDWNPDREYAAIDGLLSRSVDGILFVEYSHHMREDLLRQSGKPFGFVHRLFGAPVANSMVPDDAYGAALAVEHLLALGHRRIALISGPAGWHNARERVNGYMNSLQRNQIVYDPDLVEYGDWEVESGYTAAVSLLKQPAPPSAIFAANDLMALGAIYAARDKGIEVPTGLAVVGYDNRDFARILRPSLTTVTMPVYEMGRRAAAALLRQIETGVSESPEVKVRGELLVRESCGAPPERRTMEEPNATTTLRRILLNRHPEA